MSLPPMLLTFHIGRAQENVPYVPGSHQTLLCALCMAPRSCVLPQAPLPCTHFLPGLSLLLLRDPSVSPAPVMWLPCGSSRDKGAHICPRTFAFLCAPPGCPCSGFSLASTSSNACQRQTSLSDFPSRRLAPWEGHLVYNAGCWLLAA